MRNVGYVGIRVVADDYVLSYTGESMVGDFPFHALTFPPYALTVD